MDVLVLRPSYPRALTKQKYVFSGGVVAAFECKLTLRKRDIKKAFHTAAVIKRRDKPILGTPYDELSASPIVGLLAHSQSLGDGRPSAKLHEAVEAFQAEAAEHPREMLDILCVADTARLPLAKSVLVGPNLSKDERQELADLGVDGAVAAMYVIQEEDHHSRDLDFTGAILAGLIYELTCRLAYEDESIRPWADHISRLGFYGGIGRPIYCSKDALSKRVRNELKKRRPDEGRWSKWNTHLP